MTDPSSVASLSIVEGIDRILEYFRKYDPDTKSIKYNYRDKSSEMTIKITISDSVRRNLKNVYIPIDEGYTVDEMYSSDLEPVREPWYRKGDCWVLNPAKLPSNDEYIIKFTQKKIEEEKFDKIIELKSSKDSVEDEGIEQHWINARILDKETFEEIYKGFQINNIELSINVGVHKCFSTAIPEELTDMFKRTRELLGASSRGERGNVTVAHKRRHKAQQKINMSESEAAEIIRSLAMAENVGQFITIENPFSRESIEPTAHNNALPSEVGVDVSTDLSLQNEAAAGNLKFMKEDYTDYLRDETEDII